MRSYRRCTELVLALAVGASGPVALVQAGQPEAHATCLGRVQDRWITAFQSEDGRWAAALPSAAPEQLALLAPAVQRHDLATTVAVTWALLGDGHSPTRGQLRASVARAVDWIVAEVSDRPVLSAAEPLAAAFLTDLASLDESRTAGAAALRQQARLLSLQSKDGGWRLEARAPDDSTCIEATGWAAWTMGQLASDGENLAAKAAFERARHFLRAHTADHAGSVFTLYFDVAEADGDPAILADAAQRLVELDGDQRWLDSAPQLEFVLSAAAYRLGGKPWKRWSVARLKGVAAQQRRTGPAKGFWPKTGDARGSAWDLGFKLLSLHLYYRYARHGLVR